MFEDQKQLPSPPPTGAPLPPRPSERGGLANAPVAKPPSAPVVLEVPKGAAKSPSPGLVIHAMPKEYYGIAPKTPVKRPVALPVLSPVPSSPLPKPAAPLVQKKKRPVPIVAILGALFVVVIALGGYLFLRSIRQPAPRLVVEEPQPKPTPEKEPIPLPPPPTPEPIRPGIDTDSDGLTDMEERRIYFTNPSDPDSDGDSFIDGNEVYHLYDPSRPTPAVLHQATALMHRETFVTVSVIVPNEWTRQPGVPLDAATFVTENGDRMNIVVESGEPGKTLQGVYQGTAPGRVPAPFTSKQGYPGLRHPDYLDQRRIILAVDGQFFILDYDLGESVRTVEYLRTFEMMVNSLLLND